LARGSLAGKVAILTGASGGIGEALAYALAAEGVRVALSARRIARLTDVAAEIAEAGGQALAIPADVTDDAQVEALVQRVIDTWGRIDVVIANAGIYLQVPCADLDLACLEQAMEINYFGAMRPVLAALPHMRKQGSGHLMFMSSIAAHIPLPGDAPYVASKAALAGVAQVLRQELAHEGIAVTTIYPGRIDTPMIDHLRTPWISPKASPQVLAQKIVTGLRRRQRRIVYPSTGYLYLLRELSPALGDWLIRVLRLQGLSASSHNADSSR
jgi:NAD(P)-dependent dehydrogenase (short-subunit alcohol dehydrogenase family)